MMAEGGNLAEQVVTACQNGDAHTLQSLMSSAVDLSMVTEDGVTLLMHVIIGAGIYIYRDFIRIILYHIAA